MLCWVEKRSLVQFSRWASTGNIAGWAQAVVSISDVANDLRVACLIRSKFIRSDDRLYGQRAGPQRVT